MSHLFLFPSLHLISLPLSSLSLFLFYVSCLLFVHICCPLFIPVQTHIVHRELIKRSLLLSQFLYYFHFFPSFVLLFLRRSFVCISLPLDYSVPLLCSARASTTSTTTNIKGCTNMVFFISFHKSRIVHSQDNNRGYSFTDYGGWVIWL